MDITDLLLNRKYDRLQMWDYFIITFGENELMYFGDTYDNTENLVTRIRQGNNGLFVCGISSTPVLMNGLTNVVNSDYIVKLKNSAKPINNFVNQMTNGLSLNMSYKFMATPNGWNISPIKKIIQIQQENKLVEPEIQEQNIILKELDIIPDIEKIKEEVRKKKKKINTHNLKQEYQFLFEKNNEINDVREMIYIIKVSCNPEINNNIYNNYKKQEELKFENLIKQKIQDKYVDREYNDMRDLIFITKVDYTGANNDSDKINYEIRKILLLRQFTKNQDNISVSSLIQELEEIGDEIEDTTEPIENITNPVNYQIPVEPLNNIEETNINEQIIDIHPIKLLLNQIHKNTQDLPIKQHIIKFIPNSIDKNVSLLPTINSIDCNDTITIKVKCAKIWLIGGGGSGGDNFIDNENNIFIGGGGGSGASIFYSILRQETIEIINTGKGGNNSDGEDTIIRLVNENKQFIARGGKRGNNASQNKYGLGNIGGHPEGKYLQGFKGHDGQHGINGGNGGINNNFEYCGGNGGNGGIDGNGLPGMDGLIFIKFIP